MVSNRTSIGTRLLESTHSTRLTHLPALARNRRYRWDSTAPRDLIRISIGLEEPDDLIADLAQAFDRLATESTSAPKKKTCTTA